MKPIEIFEAMQDIPEKYIEAAKPAVKAGGESPAQAEKTVPAAKTVSTDRKRPDTKNRQTGKERIRMSSKQAPLQRIATGLAATAACAVFVGGGWFIMQQAKQNHAQPPVSSEVNFLGGTGEIHVADNAYMVYDDSKLYFANAAFEASRSGGELEEVKKREPRTDIYWDGEQFYQLENDALYRIDMQGSHIDQTPFFTISNAAFSSPAGKQANIANIRKITDDYYYICMSDGNMRDWQEESITTIMNHSYTAYLYQPATGQTDEILSVTAEWQPQMLTDGHDTIVSAMNGTPMHITLDPPEIKPLTALPENSLRQSGVLIENGCLYYVDRHADEENNYCKLDLDTQVITTIQSQANDQHVPYNGKIYTLKDEDSKLVCFDPDWTNEETVFDLRSNQPDAVVKALDAVNSYSIVVGAIDDAYVLISANENLILIDRKAGTSRLLSFESIINGAEQVADTDVNVLGGKGALHGRIDGTLMYDDTIIYLNNLFSGWAKGSRNPDEQITKLTTSPQSTPLVFDGKDWYTQEGTSLYRLDQNGRPETAPFFTVREDDLQPERNAADDRIVSEYFVIDRLTEDSYHIFYSRIVEPNQSETAERSCGYLYNAATGETRKAHIPNNRKSYLSIPVGDQFCCGPFENGAYYLFTPEEYSFELHTLPDVEFCFGKDDALYGVRRNPGNPDALSWTYLRYFPQTRKTEILSDEMDCTPSFIPYDGMIYTMTKDESQIICYDAELKNKTVLVDFKRDVPKEIRNSERIRGDAPFMELEDVNEAYVMANVNDYAKLVLDRQTGQIRFYLMPDDETEQQTETAPAATTTAITTTTAATTTAADILIDNVFGGNGIILPVDWDEHGETNLFRDDESYYFFSGQWYRAPLTGGQSEPLPPRINGAQAPSQPFISDGERVYTKELIIVSEGTAANRFDPAEVTEFIYSMNSDYECRGIWHIKNRYYMHVASSANEAGFEIWTDESGKILSNTAAPANTTRYFCNGTKTQMMVVQDAYIDVRDCPGDEINEKPDPLAYGEIIDAYRGWDDEYYITTGHQLYTRVNGEPVQISERATFFPYFPTLAPDGSFCFVEAQRLNYAVCRSQDGQTEEIYASADYPELEVRGFEKTATGGYSIVMRAEKDGSDRYLFLDPASGEILKHIQ